MRIRHFAAGLVLTLDCLATLAAPADLRPLPYPPSRVLAGLEWTSEPHRYPEIRSDMHWQTWGADDALWSVDGDGWFPGAGDYYGSLARITGAPPKHRIELVTQLRELRIREDHTPGGMRRYFCGPLAVDTNLYVCIYDYDWRIPGKNVTNQQDFLAVDRYSKLGGIAGIIVSRDGGRTWSNAPRQDTPRFLGPNFGNLQFIGFGPGYTRVPPEFGDYVYAVSNDSNWESGDHLYLARVHRDKVLDRAAWEFFAGTIETPVWTRDEAAAKSVFRDPGHVGHSDMTYVPGLKRFLLSVFSDTVPHRENATFEETKAWEKHTELQLYEGPTPWGPWGLVHREQPWGGPDHACYLPHIPGKWLDADGLGGWMLYSGDWESSHYPKGEYYGYMTRKFRLQKREEGASVTPGLVTCSNLTLKLDGQPVWVEHLAKECPADAPDWFRRGASSNLTVAIASFQCRSPVTLSLHLDQPAVSVIVRPKSLKVPVSGGGQEWTLALPGPCKLYIEIGSLPPLLVFAEAPDAGPAPDPARTRSFGPGVHEPGLITLEDDAQVYLAPGAIVYGGLRGGPKNARVFGQGILDGSRLNDSMVRLTGASNVVVEGITTRCGRGWQNTLADCDQITYRNVKVLSFTPSGDGINPVGSRNILIEDCFFRCSDDCVAVKAPHPGPPVTGIMVRNCTMAGYAFSDGFTIGYETVTPIMENITVRNCDILYARGGTRAGQHSAFSIICDGPATVRNVTFEDIRVEENVTRLFELNVTDGQFYTRTAPGRIQNVRLKNIQWETLRPILISGHDAAHPVTDVVFEGCRIAGQPLAATQIQTNAFVQQLVVR